MYFRCIGLAVIAASSLVPFYVSAQSAVTSTGQLTIPGKFVLPVGADVPEQAPASEWAVWFAFYDSIEFYRGQQPTANIESLLTEKTPMTTANARAVLEAGREYLQQYAEIDEWARAEALSYLQANSIPQLTSKDPLERSLAALLEKERRSEGLPVPWNFTATERARALAGELQQRKEELIQLHKQHLADVIGAVKMTALEQWIEENVAPNVKTVVRGREVSAPPPLQSLLPSARR